MYKRLAISIVAVGFMTSPGAGVSNPAQSPSYGVGHAPSAQELRVLGSEVLPDGRGLPPGSGTAEAGKLIYASRCAVCHGPSGKEGPQDVLVGGVGSLNTSKPLKTVGSYWPYATTIWDYVNRAMPFDHPGTMAADDVYAVTAYLLFLNNLVGERDVIDGRTLPGIRMPNRDGFFPDNRLTAERPKK